MNKTFKTPYFNEIVSLLERMETEHASALRQAAQAVADCLEKGGILHTFGCGHSGSVALEPFHRSGCFASVNAVLDPGLMFQHGAHAGTDLERLEGYAPLVFKRHDLQKGDVLFVVSNSGRNPAGIDAALYAKERGVTVIAITAASAHAQSQSRHSSGKLLKDAADIVVDNCASKNETCLKLGDLDLAPISTIGGCAALHAVLYQAAEILAQKGVPPPVYKSSNAAGNDEYNTALANKYKKRIKHID